MFREFLVGQCFWQIGHTKPSVCKCFASTCTLTTEVRFEVNSHSEQPHCPSARRYTRDFIASFISSKINNQIYLFLLIMFISPTMNQQSIFCFAIFQTNWTIIARSWGMMGLNVASDVCLVFAHITAVCAIPATRNGVFYCLRINQGLKRI